jgi:hypothetical protein
MHSGTSTSSYTKEHLNELRAKSLLNPKATSVQSQIDIVSVEDDEATSRFSGTSKKIETPSYISKPNISYS